VILKFVSDLRHVGDFLRVLRFPPPIKLTGHDITEILLKVALNTIKPTKPNKTSYFLFFNYLLWPGNNLFYITAEDG
jgi:hypothetical protein